MQATTVTILSAALPPAESFNWVGLVQAMAWPLVALVALFVAVLSGPTSGWLRGLGRRMSKVSAFGVEVQLTEDASTEITRVTQESFTALRTAVKVEFDRLIHANQIEDKRNSLVEDHVIPSLKKHGAVPEFRCTLHVPDVLFTETLYQLLDYYPRVSGANGGGGRTFSFRFGMLGKAWRSRESDVDSHVTTVPAQLIRDWGMTREEASSAGKSRQSFAGVVLKESGTCVCVVYLDSSLPGAFGDTNDAKWRSLREAITAGAESLKLTPAVAKIMHDMWQKTPLMRLYDR